MRRQAWDHPSVADHFGVVIQTVDSLGVFVDQLLGGRMMNQAEGGSSLPTFPDRRFRFSTGCGGVSSTLNQGVHQNHLSAFLFLCLSYSAENLGNSGKGRHYGIHSSV